MPVTFGSFTGRGLGKSGEKVVTVPKIQPSTTKMILVAGGGAAGPTVMGIVANSFSLAIASYSSGFIALIGIFFLRFLVKETLIKKTKK